MATSIFLKFLTLKCDISKTIWRIEVSDGSLFCIFHALSFKLNLFFDRTCPLKLQKVIFISQMCLKTSVQIAPQRRNLEQQTVCASYVALRCLLCWLCLARYLCYNSLSGTFCSFSKCAAKGFRCFADILIPIASDVYLEGMPEKLLQRLRCSVKHPVLQAICANCAEKWQRHRPAAQYCCSSVPVWKFDYPV